MSCNNGPYCPKCGTWGSKCGTLDASNWAPYSGEPYFTENYYASGNTSWTTGGNVTPYNHGLKHNYTRWKSKEGYTCHSCKPTPYVRANKAWGGQKPYQS